MKKLALFYIFLLNLLLTGCWIYSFSGVSFGNLKTATVHYFDNKAAIVNPNLAPILTEKLQDKIIRESPLKLVTSDGDIVFSGTIVQYEVKPTAVQAGETAISNSLIVVVKVKVTNNLEPDNSFEKNFRAEVTFDATENFADVEDQLVDEITDQLVDQIFYETFSNW